MIDHRSARKPVPEQRLVVGEHRVEADRKLLFVDELDDRAKGVGIGPGIMNLRQAVRRDSLRTGEDATLALLERSCRNHALDEVRGCIYEDTGRLS